MRFLIISVIFVVFITSNSFGLETQGTIVSVVCDKPKTLFNDGQRYIIQDNSIKNLNDLTLQLDKTDNKIRFKRGGEWSSWFDGIFKFDEVSWDVTQLNNTTEEDNIFKDFEYWKFNFDLINRRVVESFVEKSEKETETIPKPRGFNYLNCKVVDPLPLN